MANSKIEEHLGTLVAAMKTIDTEPIFSIGQTVRVVSHIEINFPAELDYWLGAKCEVLSLTARGMFCPEWWYQLRHPNGEVCDFNAGDLDHRYAKRKQKPKPIACVNPDTREGE